MQRGDLLRLRQGAGRALAAHLRPDDPPALYLFSRSGFEQPLREAAAADPRLKLVGVEQM